MDFKIAIPSGNRKNSKNFKTIFFLKQIGIIENIYLFLHNETDIKDYIENYDLNNINIVASNAKNIVEQRNYIEKDYFDNGEKILCLDDDIIGLKYKNEEGKIVKMTNKKEFISNFNLGFDLLIKEKCSLFGVYPVGGNDKWFSESKLTIGNNHILAGCSGIIIDKTIKRQNPKLAIKEEYERGFLYGKNIRLNTIAIITKYYGNDGIGIRTYEKQLETCKEIMKNYPNRYSKTPLKFNKKKTNCDLRLNKTYYNRIC